MNISLIGIEEIACRKSHYQYRQLKCHCFNSYPTKAFASCLDGEDVKDYYEETNVNYLKE